MTDNPSSQIQTFLTAVKHAEEGIIAGTFDEKFFALFSEDLVFQILPPTPNLSTTDKNGFRKIVDAVLKGYQHYKVGLYSART